MTNMKIPLSFLILAMLVISGCVEKEPSITQNELYFCNHDNDCFNPCRGSTPVDKDYFCVNKLEFETNKDRYKQFACLDALPTYVCVCENNRCTAKTREPNTDLNQTEKTNCENSGGKWVQECTTTGLCSSYFCDCDLGREETDNHTIIIERYKLEKNNVCVECETNDECAEGLVYGVRGCVQSRDYCKEYHRYCENGVCIFKSVEYGDRQCINDNCVETILLSDVPEKAKDFLFDLLSEDYVREHFRFYYQNEQRKKQNIVDFYLVYKNIIASPLAKEHGSYLQWDLPILEGKMRYSSGPDAEYNLNVREDEAVEKMIEKRCDTSNIKLTIYPTNIKPDNYECQHCGIVAWYAGGQERGKNCFKNQCIVNVDSGNITVIPEMCIDVQ